MTVTLRPYHAASPTSHLRIRSVACLATCNPPRAQVIRKRVFTLIFERSSELGWTTVEKLVSARRNHGVVLCSASTIKSLQLKLLEKMDVLRDPTRKQHPTMEVDLRALVEVMSVFKASCLIMDEGTADPTSVAPLATAIDNEDLNWRGCN